MPAVTQLANSVSTVLVKMIAPASRRFLIERGVVRRREAGEGQAAAGGRHAGGVDDVLDADRDAVQRPAHAARRRARGRGTSASCHRAGADRGGGVDPVFVLVDAIDVGLHQLARVDAPVVQARSAARRSSPRRCPPGGCSVGRFAPASCPSCRAARAETERRSRRARRSIPPAARFMVPSEGSSRTTADERGAAGASRRALREAPAGGTRFFVACSKA